MCTLVVLNRVHPTLPVVLAANRDELYARPAEGPQRLVDVPRVVGGRDPVGGGTWLGLTPSGFFVGVTNQPAVPDPSRQSRGALVMDLLRRGSTEGAAEHLQGLPPRAFNPFNLMFGDAAEVWFAHARDDAPTTVGRVPSGLHFLPNGVLDAPHCLQVERARAHLAEPSREWEALGGQLRAVLADDQVQVRTSHYGTRSATIIALRPGGVAHYLHAEGPADVAPFEDFAWLLS